MYRKALEASFVDPNIKVFVLASKWFDNIRASNRANLEWFASKLRQHPEKKCFILLDPPWDQGVNGRQGTFDPLNHFNRFSSNRSDFLVSYPKNQAWKKGNEEVQKIFAGVATIISVESYTLKYKDDDHLNPVFIEKNGYWLDQVYEQI